MTLLIFANHLTKMHTQFFKGLESQIADIRFYIKKLKQFSPLKVSFEHLIKNVPLAQTFEGFMCQVHGLNRVDSLGSE